MGDRERHQSVPVHVEGAGQQHGAVLLPGEEVFVERGNIVVLNATNSTDNIGIVGCVWFFEYNGWNTTLKDAVCPFEFHLPGEYNVTLEVRDAAGNHRTEALLVFVNDTAEEKIVPEEEVKEKEDDDDEEPESDDTEGESTTPDGGESSIFLPLLITGILFVLILSTGSYLVFVLIKGKDEDSGMPPTDTVPELTAEIEHAPFGPPPPPRPPEGPGISLEYDLPEDVRRRAARPYPESLPGSGPEPVYAEEPPILPGGEAKLKMTGETGERQKALPQVSAVSDERET